MMVMTAKVNFKKVMIILAAVAAVILGLVLMLGGGETQETAAPASVATNDGRVQFLKDFGWEVTTSPVESSQVKIPSDSGPVFDRYNALQKSQGYDLSQYAGKTVMRFVYEIKNYPGAREPVYATLLVYKNRIIGGDVTNTGAKGKIHSFQMPQNTAPSTQSTDASTEGIS